MRVKHLTVMLEEVMKPVFTSDEMMQSLQKRIQCE